MGPPCRLAQVYDPGVTIEKRALSWARSRETAALKR